MQHAGRTSRAKQSTESASTSRCRLGGSGACYFGAGRRGRRGSCTCSYCRIVRDRLGALLLVPIIGLCERCAVGCRRPVPSGGGARTRGGRRGGVKRRAAHPVQHAAAARHGGQAALAGPRGRAALPGARAAGVCAHAPRLQALHELHARADRLLKRARHAVALGGRGEVQHEREHRRRGQAVLPDRLQRGKRGTRAGVGEGWGGGGWKKRVRSCSGTLAQESLSRRKPRMRARLTANKSVVHSAATHGLGSGELDGVVGLGASEPAWRGSGGTG